MSTISHLCFFSFGGDGVNLINEDDGRGVLLCLLKSFAEVALTLPGKLGHDLWTIDEEKEGTSLIGNCSSNQGLACSTASSQKAISSENPAGLRLLLFVNLN